MPHLITVTLTQARPMICRFKQIKSIKKAPSDRCFFYVLTVQLA